MVKITISELNPADSEPFSDFESFVESTEEISEAKLSATKGGGDGEGLFIINSNNNNYGYGGSSSSSSTIVISGGHITTICKTG
jgi:hypothetical protein